jgi:hypothetical protein
MESNTRELTMNATFRTLGCAMILAAIIPLAHAARIDVDRPGHSADTTMPRTASTTAPPASAPDAGGASSGDPDSFGRTLQFLGLADGNIFLLSDCNGDTTDCQTLAPAPAATSFSFNDIGRIALPARAAHSLICYWFSPFLTIGYGNDSGSPVVANLEYTPTVTIENPLLDDPSLIDPTTGQPFNGSLLTGMTSQQSFDVPLPAATHVTERTRDSAVCIAGLISRDTLVQLFGLSDAQAKDFFKQPMTLKLNVDGNAQYVDSATLYFGWRLVGD